MGKRQRDWARKETERLRTLLGGQCVKCEATEELEFDLIIPKGNSFHSDEMEWSWRMSFYRRELAQGNVQLLCRECNARKGNQLELTGKEPVEEPF